MVQPETEKRQREILYHSVVCTELHHQHLVDLIPDGRHHLCEAAVSLQSVFLHDGEWHWHNRQLRNIVCYRQQILTVHAGSQTGPCICRHVYNTGIILLGSPFTLSGLMCINDQLIVHNPAQCYFTKVSCNDLTQNIK